jgi:hypothetical protein
MWLAPARIAQTSVNTFLPGTRSADAAFQPEHAVHDPFETEPDHEGRRHDEAGIGDEARLVEGHLHPIETARY